MTRRVSWRWLPVGLCLSVGAAAAVALPLSAFADLYFDRSECLPRQARDICGGDLAYAASQRTLWLLSAVIIAAGGLLMSLVATARARQHREPADLLPHG